MVVIASTIEMLPVLLLLWLICIIPLLAAAAIWWVDRRSRLCPWRDLCFLATAPYVLWWGLYMVNDVDKTMPNVFWEPLILSAYVGVIAVVGQVLRRSFANSKTLLLLYSSTIVAAVLLWLLVPAFPE